MTANYLPIAHSTDLQNPTSILDVCLSIAPQEFAPKTRSDESHQAPIREAPFLR
jgi:hypothetical protein